MNAVLILLLCSVACCFASPSEKEMRNCAEKEMQKCNQGYIDPSDFSEKGIEKQCKQLECWITVYEKCRLNESAEGRRTYRQYKKSFKATCDKKNPMREKLLRNLQCITDAQKADESRECKLHLEVTDHELFCRKITKTIQCLYDVVFQRCGQDGKDAFAEVYPDAKYHGC